MKFRTEIEIRRATCGVKHTDRIVTVGSCFSDAIGTRLVDAGFDVVVNPMGVLFNPVSIVSTLERALESREYTAADLYCDTEGTWHALDYESRRRDTDPDKLLATLNSDFAVAAAKIRQADVWMVTFGTAWCFYHRPTARVVGNCHKLPDSDFERRLVSIDEIVRTWSRLIGTRRVILTVSPVRHLNDGLHGNTLSKARLHLAVERLCEICPAAEYFPAYEAIVDDLRDYRFYADDLKHPSKMAEEYVFNLFGRMFFDRDTASRAAEAMRSALRARHRQIL